MPFTHAEVLTAAQRSLTAAGAHDRDGWLALFTEDARVEDPVGSAPHRGRLQLGRFYDTFIGPRAITHHAEGDVAVDNTVIRDVLLEIEMAASVVLRVPTYIRYDLRAVGDDLKISALSAYWELPAMIAQFTRSGLAALPAGISLSRAMLSHQGLAGGMGFLRGLRGTGRSGAALFTRFLDDACGGDEVGIRRLVSEVPVTVGDDEPVAASDLVKHLSGARWSKLVTAGRSVAVRIDSHGRRSVLIATIDGSGAAGSRIARIQIFGQIN